MNERENTHEVRIDEIGNIAKEQNSFFIVGWGTEGNRPVDHEDIVGIDEERQSGFVR